MQRPLNTAMSAMILVVACAAPASSQIDYRNTDTGRPVRIADATPTERRALELSFASGRVDRLTLGRYRLQLEPRLAYGILPRSEVSLRVPVFFYERSISPRAGIAGVGIGGEHQLKLESLRVPGLTLAGEVFAPTGPAAVRTSYSMKGIATRTLSAARVHLNASYGSFSVRVPGTDEPIIPPFHGPCALQLPGDAPRITTLCSPASFVEASSALAALPIRTHGQWMTGIAVDKAFPLRSLLVIADVFAQKYTGIGRPVDWTGEVGARAQLTHRIVVDGAVGRLFTGESRSWFVNVGATLSRPLSL